MKSIQSNIKKAKKYLDKNDCVAVPTETVYGLAGNAYSNRAVTKIYSLKKRPKKNPLIVHFDSFQSILKETEQNPYLRKLYRKFSPGPITYVLKLKKKSMQNILNILLIAVVYWYKNIKAEVVRMLVQKIVKKVWKNGLMKNGKINVVK